MFNQYQLLFLFLKTRVFFCIYLKIYKFANISKNIYLKVIKTTLKKDIFVRNFMQFIFLDDTPKKSFL